MNKTSTQIAAKATINEKWDVTRQRNIEIYLFYLLNLIIIVVFLSAIVTILTRSFCQMQANSSGTE